MTGHQGGVIARTRPVRLLLAVLFTGSGFMFWLLGAQSSGLLQEDHLLERGYVATILQTRAPDYELEKNLAEAYWARYPDVRKHWLWGEGGTMGVRGPRDHFRLHGRREGRVWGLE